MITRACISINNRCDLNCKYCHFHEKKESIQETEMVVFPILDNIMEHIDKYNIEVFKLGFVGNGEPLLDYNRLESYLLYIEPYLNDGRIAAYTITNGLLIDREKLEFFQSHNVNVGFSIDGIREIHDKYRCNTYGKVMEKIELYKEVFGEYPSINCTVGKDVLQKQEETINLFAQFNSRITFSRMIGKYGISLDEFHVFLDRAAETLNVRRGGYDCTMYGGLCGAGMNNVFYANGKIYVCGNCIDLPITATSDTALDKICFNVGDFDRTRCFKEVFDN